jgi:glutamate-1-semialdehyde 2,1-aminomutase
MKYRDYSGLLKDLAADYERHSPRSAALNREALASMVDGGSHTVRLIRPFPPRIAKASGACVTDEDGHEILDFWQGHYANILGHNPAVITEALAATFRGGFGLQSGFTDRLQIETAELLLERTGAEKVRFTTSGSLSTMYAILLSRAFTGRSLVMKAGGGWHGAQPWGLIGVDFHTEDKASFGHAESRGLPAAVEEDVVITRYNDASMLESQFRTHGDRIACLILEPVIGSAGFLPAEPGYLKKARELASRHGALLVFDEVISGFRFRAGNAGSLYGVTPDLSTYAKIMGGGMPVAAVAGRADVMALAGRGGSVRFSGGTYSCHPASLLASRTIMRWLADHEAEGYPALAALGDKARRAVEAAFASEGMTARCTGEPNAAIPGSSVGAVLFPYKADAVFRSPDDTKNPEASDVELSERVVQLALLLEDVFVMHGLGAVSTAHTKADISRLGDACARAARRIKKFARN